MASTGDFASALAAPVADKKMLHRKKNSSIASVHDTIMQHPVEKSPVRWFYRTVPLHREMTPALAKATAKVLTSALEPNSTSASPATCRETLVLIEDRLKRRRSERIQAQEARDAEAKEAADKAQGAARAAFKLAIASRPVKRQRSVDNYGRAHVF